MGDMQESLGSVRNRKESGYPMDLDGPVIGPCIRLERLSWEKTICPWDDSRFSRHKIRHRDTH